MLLVYIYIYITEFKCTGCVFVMRIKTIVVFELYQTIFLKIPIDKERKKRVV